jgi:N6-adenosine-specific RNA methylase IME4
MTATSSSLAPFPSCRKYGVIYADPPWSFRTWSDKGTGRGAISHYDTMGHSALAALPVAEIAAQDSALLLWTTDPLLPSALELITAWGFTFKTVGFTWVKTNAKSEGYFTGMGYWTRSNPEMCLLATRGRPVRVARNVPQLVVAPRREHSRKPDEVPERIKRLLPGPYIELFARETRPGWDSWGNQTELFDAGSVATRRQPSILSPATPTARGSSKPSEQTCSA